jgi:hypothetical protein
VQGSKGKVGPAVVNQGKSVWLFVRGGYLPENDEKGEAHCTPQPDFHTSKDHDNKCRKPYYKVQLIDLPQEHSLLVICSNTVATPFSSMQHQKDHSQFL